MLGIVIAVAAVMATVSIGQGAQAKVAQQMESLGSNLLMVLPGSIAMHGVATGSGATQNLTRDDATAIERELGNSVAAVAPINRTGAKVVYGDQTWFTQVQGTTAAYLQVRAWPVAQGEAFGREEDVSAAKVCLLGQTVVNKLFVPGAPVLGEQVRVKHVPCKVIGILAGKGNAFGTDEDDTILMPWTTVVRRLIGSQSDAVGRLMVSARSSQHVADAEREVTALLRQRRGGGDGRSTGDGGREGGPPPPPPASHAGDDRCGGAGRRDRGILSGPARLTARPHRSAPVRVGSDQRGASFQPNCKVAVS